MDDDRKPPAKQSGVKQAYNAKRRVKKTNEQPNEVNRNEYMQNYRMIHKEVINEQSRDRRAAHRDQYNEQRRAHHASHSSDINQQRRKRERENHTDTERKRKSRKAKADVEDYTRFKLDDEAFHVSEEQLESVLRELKRDCFTLEEKKKRHRTVFGDVSNSPLKALLLFYLNSGAARFGEWKYYSKKHEGEPIDVQALKDEILGEKLTEEELGDMLKRFDDKHNPVPSRFLSCAACGMRVYEEKYCQVTLSDPIMEKFQMTKAEQLVHEYNRGQPSANIYIYVSATERKLVNAWDIKSAYKSEELGTWFHLHPELVDLSADGVETVWLCETCGSEKGHVVKEVDDGRKIKVPVNSIANGVDFGNRRRISLKESNLHEKMIVSANRLYMACYKVSSNQKGRVNVNIRSDVKVHAVLFTHNAPTATAVYMNKNFSKLDPAELEKDVVVQFLSDDGKFDMMARRIMGSGTLFARWWHLLSLFRVLKVTSPYFRHLEVPAEITIQQWCTEAQRLILERSEHVEDPSLVELDNTIGSDIVGVRQEVIPDGVTLNNTDTGSHSVSEEQKVHVSVHFVMDNPTANQQSREAAVTRQCLKAVHDTIQDNDLEYNGNTQSFSRVETLNNDPAESQSDNNQAQRDASTDELSVSSIEGQFSACASIPNGDIEDANDSLVPEECKEDTNTGILTQDAVAEMMGSLWNANVGAVRSSIPQSEFSCPDMLPSTFPTTFMLGCAYTQNKTANLSSRNLHHLLHQFTGIPSTDHRLLGYLADVKGRFAVMHGVSAAVKSSKKSQALFSELLMEEEKRNELKQAIMNPESKLAATLMKRYFPHVDFAGRDISGSIQETSKLKATLIESQRRYGPASSFVTLAPDDSDNPRSFRASFWSSSNTSFPAVFNEDCPFGVTGEEFLTNLRRSYTEVMTMEVDGRGLDLSSRAEAAMSDPVAFVDECKRVISDVCSILLGKPLEHFFGRDTPDSTRRTWVYTCHKGILGHCFAIIGVMEDHAKGTLHFHILFIGGLDPSLLQRYASQTALQQAIVEVLESQQCGTLSARALLAKLVKDHVVFKIPAWEQVTTPPVPFVLRNACLSDLSKRAENNGRSTQEQINFEVDSCCKKQYHNHTMTCYPVKKGRRMTECRLDMPQAQTPQTVPVLLKRNLQITKKRNEVNKMKEPSYLVEEIVLDDSAPVYSCTNPVERPNKDSVVYWELKRPPAESILGNFIEEGTAISRQEILDSFQNCLEDCKEVISFKHFKAWLYELSDDELIDFYSGMVVRLQKAMGYVAAYNVTLTRLTTCHNNVLLLGSMDQAVNAVFYICPYMGKKKLPLLESLTVLYNSVLHVKANPSTAVDRGSVQRNAIHVLERTLNQMNLKMELSQYQVVASLLGLPTLLTTETYAVMKPRAEMAMVAALRYPDHDIAKMLIPETDNCDEKEDCCKEDDSLESLNGFIASSEENSSSNSDTDSRDENTNDENDSQEGEYFSSVDSSSEEEIPVVDSEDDVSEIEREQEEELAKRLPREDLQALLGGIGSSKCYIYEEDAVDGTPRKCFVPHSFLASNRGYELRHLSRYELVAITELRKKPTNEDAARLRYFSLPSGFILSANYGRVLVQKQKTPLLTTPMPKPPGPRPSGGKALAKWKGDADHFAWWALTNYRSEPDFYDSSEHVNPYDYSFKALMKWIEELESDDNVISKFRLLSLHRSVQNMRGNRSLAEIQREYRARCRDSKTSNDAVQGTTVFPETEPTLGLPGVAFPFPLLTPQQLQGRFKRLYFLQQCLAEFKRVSVHVTQYSHTQGPLGSPFPSSMPTNPTGAQVDAITNQLETLAAHIQSLTATDLIVVSSQPQLDNSVTVTHELPVPVQFEPNWQQAQLGETIFDSLFPQEGGHQKITPMLPAVTLLTGCAGTGKSQFLLWVKAELEARGFRVFTTTFNHINALHVKGVTTASAIDFAHLGCSNNMVCLRSTDLQKFRMRTGIRSNNEGHEKGVDLIVLDEVSNYAPFHVANFEAACRAATGVDKPFGGIPTVFMGDLYQLGPVKAGETLTQAVAQKCFQEYPQLVKEFNERPRIGRQKQKKLKLHRSDDERMQPGHPYSVGANLFRESKWFSFDIQQRSKEDPIHGEIVQKLGHGGQVTKEDLNQWKYLSAADLKEEKWLRAPMIVTLNHEKLVFTHERSILLGKFLNKPVIRWVANISTNGAPEEELVATGEPIYFEYYVESCLAFLSGTVAKEVGLVNALQVCLHSLIPSCAADCRAIRERCEQGEFGVITLSKVPSVINVELTEGAIDSLPPGAKEKLKSLSLYQGVDREQIVVPIMPGAGRSEPIKVASSIFPSNPTHDVQYRTHFPLEMGLVMSVNRAEGQTLKDGVILAVSKRDHFNLTHSGFYVGVSRVKQKEDLRLFCAGETMEDKEKNCQYLLDLKPDPTIGAFLAGFGQKCDYTQWHRRKFAGVNTVSYLCRDNPEQSHG